MRRAFCPRFCLYLPGAGANILTINQSIPVNGQAAVTVAARTGEMNRPVEQMMSEILAIAGVSRMEILAKE